MNAKSILIGLIIIGTLSLSGCVSTPYYGGLGYYRSTVYGYGHQSPIYINPGYIGAHKHFIGGPRHMRGGYQYFIGGHKHLHGRHNFIGRHYRGGYRR
ncbi:hypothetical protein SAMN05216406_10229 [Nitrosomonas ureae]|uniref:Lipoprotein n=1 Tax=Nitrosomonas ureae TaxID=44577 RepID=A0A1H2DP95_9PROT|nr:hypothetical protein SAMN05216406_10229 [Nitrosomonas ureae]